MKILAFNDLRTQFPGPGRIVSICTRPARLDPVIFSSEVLAKPNFGLEGDRYKNKGNRQVTLIAIEDLQAVSSFMNKEISLDMVRRNLLTQAINLTALKSARFRVGEAILEYTGSCDPCSRMEQSLGIGGYNAMRGRGGITARVLEGGIVRVNDSIEFLSEI